MSKIIGLYLFFIFTFVVLFGLNMSMSGDSKDMSSCPLAQNTASVCPMGAGEHIAHWQSLFTMTVNQNAFVLFILTLSFAGILIGLLFYQFSDLIQKYFQYLKQHLGNLSNVIINILARGILQPKLCL
ncbi:MAG: hypothetical protein HYV13_01570 [Candidatus Doudnabacteria bacterium]|nr:hypothetical protein [Candidatus Doudnabacteria bacterium]